MLIPLPKVEVATVSVKKNGEEDTLANLLYVLMQPTRQKIIKLLQLGEPLYIEQIAEKIGEDRRSVSFHLATLAENGFVEGEYREIERATKNPGRGRGAKFYRVTPRVKEVMGKLDAVLG